MYISEHNDIMLNVSFESILRRKDLDFTFTVTEMLHSLLERVWMRVSQNTYTHTRAHALQYLADCNEVLVLGW